MGALVKRPNTPSRFPTPGKAEKFVCKKDTAGETLSQSNKGRGQIKYEGHGGQEVIIKRHNLLQEHNVKKLRKKSDLVEVNWNGSSLSLPPSARIETETVTNLQPVSGSQKENVEKSAFGNGDALKASRQSMKPENQSVQPSSSRNPKVRKAKDAEVPSPVRRDSNSHAANNALKEAKDLKHLADCLKVLCSMNMKSRKTWLLLLWHINALRLLICK